MSVNLDDSRKVGNAGRTSTTGGVSSSVSSPSAGGAASSLSVESSVARHTPESHAMAIPDTEVLSREEIAVGHGNEHEQNHSDSEEDTALFLECLSESELDTETVAFDEDDKRADTNDPSCKRPEVSAKAALLVPNTKSRGYVNGRKHKVGNYCTFCGKLHTAIGLHLVIVHKDQPELSGILRLPPKSRERHEQLQFLITEGNQKHNWNVVPTKSGAGPQSNLRSWVRCKSCQKLLKRSAAYRHSLACDAAPVRRANEAINPNQSRKKSTQPQKSGSSGTKSRADATYQSPKRNPRSLFISYDNVPNYGGAETNIDDVLCLVLDGDDDSLRTVLTEDALIRRYALLQMRSLGDSSDNVYNLCQELRTLARLVLECRRQYPSADLYSLFHPDHFNLVVAASRLQPTAVVETLGRAVKMKIVDALQRDDDTTARQAWHFRELYLLWRDSLSQDNAALRTTGTSQEERHYDNRCQPSSHTFQQPDKLGCNTDTQADSEGADAMQSGACLSAENRLGDTFEDNPLQYVYPDNSFVTLALDKCIDPTNSTLQNNECFELETKPYTSTSALAEDTMDDDAFDVAEDSDVDDIDLSDDENRRSDSVAHMDSSDISSSQAITISAGSRRHSYCCFCGESNLRLTSHWKLEHSDEKELTELASLKTASARVRMLKRLRDRGVYRHNQNVLRDGRGMLLVSHCPKPDAKPKDYTPCSSCLNYLTKAELLKHRCWESGKRNKHTIGSNFASTSADFDDGISVRKKSKLSKIHEVDGIQIVSRRSIRGADSHTVRCYFCGCWKIKHMQRHWQKAHPDEPEVRELLSLGQSNSREVLLHATRLRNLGMHVHNTKVLKEGRGLLFVNRPMGQRKASDYVPCEDCWCYVWKGNHGRHSCLGRVVTKSDRADSERYRSPFDDANFLLPTSEMFRDEVSNTLTLLIDGNLKMVAESDPLFREYVAKMLSLGAADSTIINKVNLLAGFLTEVRKVADNGDMTLTECISPKNFKRCIHAVKSLSLSDCRNLRYTTRILKQLSKLLKRDAIEKMDRDSVKAADEFTELCTEWKSLEDMPAEEVLVSDTEPGRD